MLVYGQIPRSGEEEEEDSIFLGEMRRQLEILEKRTSTACMIVLLPLHIGSVGEALLIGLFCSI